MRHPLAQSGMRVQLANGISDVVGTVMHEDEPWRSIHVIGRMIMVQWDEPVPCNCMVDDNCMVLDKYYNPDELKEAKNV